MKKFMRHMAAAGVSTALAGSVFFVAGGTASAATGQVHEHAPSRTVVVQDAQAPTAHDESLGGSGVRSDSRDHGGEGIVVHVRLHTGEHSVSARIDPWIADQLVLADPWIRDQLVLFGAGAGLGV
ncbi:hypothetical protein [Streptomyces sp. SID2888]|uniref:hypothetical protein n=1 Tax=Streptomyces sp. SID2888 TaxID=2690256 RepID=UPI0013702E15|nr:hypothetical protein [Streptomyces sp. SID2888]MYV46596.1 hypothetical protein [Streptomyces sp. SID2888]